MQTFIKYMRDTIIEKINETENEDLLRYIYTMLMEALTSEANEKDIDITEKQAANS
ncbi:MAG: hypothetical protein IKJ65_01705 [Clostridia bacterium]|nr:hypothetical protein [Clostridia bacterium]